MKILLSVLCLLIFMPCAQAEPEAAQRNYYRDMAVLHKTSYALDYLLQPENFIGACQTVYRDDLGAISKEKIEKAADLAAPAVEPIREHVKENERAATLALINQLYMRSRPEEGIEYERFFAVYLSKAEKSREGIARDMIKKTPEFSKFLRLSKVLTLDKCRDRMQTGDTKSMRAFWPHEARALRSELDDLLGHTLLPDAYKTAYRRLLQ